MAKTTLNYDCNDKNITYQWHTKIDRVGGKDGRIDNNVVIIRLPPIMMQDLQKVAKTEILDSPSFKKWLCGLAGLEWNERYNHESASPYIPEVVASQRDLKAEVENMIQKYQLTDALKLNEHIKNGYAKMEKLAPLTQEQIAGKQQLREWLVANVDKLQYYEPAKSIFTF